MRREIEKEMIGEREGNEKVGEEIKKGILNGMKIKEIKVEESGSMVSEENNGNESMEKRNKMVGGKEDKIGIVEKEERRMKEIENERDEKKRKEIVLGKMDIIGRSEDRRRNDEEIRKKMKKSVNEGEMFVKMVIMVGKDESMERKVEIGLDGFENLREKRVNDVKKEEEENERKRGKKDRRKEVIDIKDGERMLIDIIKGMVGKKRNIEKWKRKGGGRKKERVRDGREINFMGKVE